MWLLSSLLSITSWKGKFVEVGVWATGSFGQGERTPGVFQPPCTLWWKQATGVGMWCIAIQSGSCSLTSDEWYFWEAHCFSSFLLHLWTLGSLCTQESIFRYSTKADSLSKVHLATQAREQLACKKNSKLQLQWCFYIKQLPFFGFAEESVGYKATSETKSDVHELNNCDTETWQYICCEDFTDEGVSWWLYCLCIHRMFLWKSCLQMILHSDCMSKHKPHTNLSPTRHLLTLAKRIDTMLTKFNCTFASLSYAIQSQ